MAGKEDPIILFILLKPNINLQSKYQDAFCGCYQEFFSIETSRRRVCSPAPTETQELSKKIIGSPEIYIFCHFIEKRYSIKSILDWDLYCLSVSRFGQWKVFLVWVENHRHLHTIWGRNIIICRYIWGLVWGNFTSRPCSDNFMSC